MSLFSVTVECVEGLQREFTEEDGARELEGTREGECATSPGLQAVKKHSLANFNRNFSKNFQNKRRKMKTQA